VEDFDAHGRKDAGGGEHPRFRLELRIGRHAGWSRTGRFRGVERPALSAHLRPILCFGRDYSPDHLARHPKQMTKSVLLAFQQGFVDVVLTSRRGAPKRIGAGCGWREGAKIDTSDRKMIANFSKAAGFDCIVNVGDSTEERGYFLIDPAPDAKSLTLSLLSPIGAESDKLGKTEGDSLNLGPEDRTFALTRIDSKACEPFKATVK
jgi:hypothetical protein